MRTRIFLSIACLMLTAGGCTTLTAHETGRTLGNERFSFTASAASGQYAEASIGGPNDERSESGDDYPGDYYPVVEIGGAIGLNDRTDVGVRVNSSFFLSGRIKRQVVGTCTSRFAASVGVEGGGNLMAMFVGGVAYTHGSVPVYGSFHPRETVAVYAVPRYTVVSIVQVLEPPSDAEASGDAWWTFPSLSYGVSLGTERRLVVELAHVGYGQFFPSQLSIGLVLQID